MRSIIVDERMAKIVEMRHFGGSTEVEIASAPGITDRTLRRAREQAHHFLPQALKR